MREMKDSGIPWIGEIPKEWMAIKLLYVLRARITDGPHETPVLVDDGIPFISIDSLNDSDTIDLSNVRKFISYDDYLRYNQKSKIEKGDILFTKAATIGKTAIVKDEVFMVWSPLAIIKADYNIVDNRFLYHILNTDNLIKDVILHGSNNTQINVGMRELEAAIIPLPSLLEQQRIADFLDRKCAEVDEMIGLQEQIIEELKAYKQSVITETITKGLNPNAPMRDSGIEWIDTIPHHWVVRKMKSLIDLKSGSNLTSEQIFDKDDGYPVYGGNGIRGTYSEYSNEGDYVLIGRQGALCGNINYASGKFWVTEHALVCYPKEALDIQWLGESLRAMNLNQYSLSAAQPGLSAERIKNLYMIVPPLTEQQAISDYLDEKCADIDSLIQTKQAKIDSLKEYKKSIIYEYVTGKREVE